MQLLLASSLALTASAQILSLPLTRRAEQSDVVSSIQQEIAVLEHKYAHSSVLKRKRATNVAITGITELANYNIDLMYQVELSVGSAGQKVTVQLDSGSSDLWVAQKGCVQCNVQDASLFDSSQSSTYSNSGEGFQTTYSSAAVRCTKATDTISIAGLSVSDASFGVCDAQVGMAYPASLGIMGLGFQGNAKSGSKPWVQQAYEQGIIAAPSFAVNLASSQGGATGGNQLTLGGYDETAISGDINWLQGQSTKFWSVALDAVTFNGQSVFSAAGDQMQTIVDTGSSLITGPPAAVQMLYSTVSGAQQVNGGWQFPCANTPSVSLNFGGQSYSIPAADLIRGYTDASKQTCLGTINSAVIANDVSKNVGWLLGDAFLKNVYTIFDMGENKVGLASKSGSVSKSGGFTKVPMTQVTTNTPAGNFAPAAGSPQQVSQQKFQLSSSVPSIKVNVPHAAGVPVVAAKKAQAQAQAPAPVQAEVQPEQQVAVASTTAQAAIASTQAVAPVAQAQSTLATVVAPVASTAQAAATSASGVRASSSTSSVQTRMTSAVSSATAVAAQTSASVVPTTSAPATSVPASGAGLKISFSASSMLVMALGTLLLL